jgi:hypothetical protein
MHLKLMMKRPNNEPQNKKHQDIEVNFDIRYFLFDILRFCVFIHLTEDKISE